MPVKINVKLDIISMEDYMVHRIYTSVPGVIAIIVGALNVALCFAFLQKKEYVQLAISAVVAVLFLIGIPYYVRLKVAKMKNSRRLTETVTYEFSDEGIVTTTSQDSGKASWSKFKRAVSKNQIIILYDDQKQAIILPVSQMGDSYTKIVDLIYDHLPAPAVRIRRSDGKKVKMDTKEQ